MVGVGNAGVDLSARYGKGGQCRSGNIGTVVGVDNAGVDLSARYGTGGQCGK